MLKNEVRHDWLDLEHLRYKPEDMDLSLVWLLHTSV